jgi:hypothetical protein
MAMRKRVYFLRLGLPAASRVVLALAIGACLTPTAAGDDPALKRQQGGVRPESIRTAVERVLPLLVKASSVEYPLHRECFSCHNQAVPALALSLARQRGFVVDAQTLRAIAEHTEADLSSAIDDYRKGNGQPGGVIRAGYALWTLEATGWKADETTTGVAHYLAVAASKRDHLPVSSRRPPSESSDFTATALALRGVLAYGPSGLAATANDGAQKKSLDQPVRAAEVPWREPVLRWLTRTKPRDTEDRVFRLWGLKSAGASADELARAVAELLEVQRLDGGWSQLDTSPESPKGEADKGGSAARATPASALQSDAYATGSVLVGLALAGGLDSKNPAYCRGLEFLLRTQRHDGSWFVKSRSRPFQAYFESGFPHGPDQFISAAASAWAVAALTLALPVP